MNPHHEPTDATNPFCSRRVRPGALPYRFPPGQAAAPLVDQLARSGWWGQIVGPHGSGKSALVAALVPAIEAAGHRVRRIELHDGQRRLPAGWRDTASPESRPTLLIVDGYEQLSPWSRFRLKRYCRQFGLGLLVTAHRCVGLPEVFRTWPEPALAQWIVAELQRGYPAHVVEEDVAEGLARHGGNLRELLFGLYDLYEQRRSSGADLPPWLP